MRHYFLCPIISVRVPISYHGIWAENKDQAENVLRATHKPIEKGYELDFNSIRHATEAEMDEYYQHVARWCENFQRGY